MRITATTSHVSDFPDPISFEPGDRLGVGTRETHYPGWVWVTVPGGNQGWAPDDSIERRSSTEAIARESYTARELDTVEGEPLRLHRERNGWLWVENAAGERGWVPKESTDLA